MVTRNVSSTPMTHVDRWSCSDDGTVDVVLSARKKNEIKIQASANGNLVLNMRKKSERSTTGIDRKRFASVELSTRTYPIFLVAGIFVLVTSIITWILTSDPYVGEAMILTSLLLDVIGFILVVMYFLSKVGRLLIRVAEDLDYRIFLKSSAVPNQEQMDAMVRALMMVSSDGAPLSNAAPSPTSAMVMETGPTTATVPDMIDEGGVAWKRMPNGTVWYRTEDSEHWKPQI